jgi:predicted DCC family thiol-disulfide oxidoreductase YuxK
MPSIAPATILFDGVCTLCNGFVQFVIRRDPQGHFRFAALQSAAGQALLAAHGQPLSAAALAQPDSVVLVAGGRVYTHSAAVLRIMGHLGGVWRLAAAGWLLPRPWRDALYRYVARHRYQWFGQQESCMLPTPALRARFL